MTKEAPEVTAEPKEMTASKEVAIVNAADYGLDAEKAFSIQNAFTPLVIERDGYMKVYENILNMEISKDAVRQARELRLKLVPIRTGIAKVHKVEKAFYLAAGKFVDACKNKLTLPVEQMESKLLEVENHFKNIEKERIAKLGEQRKSELEKYESPYIPDDLGVMEQEQYDLILNGIKNQFEANKLAAEKAEADRIENERLDHIEGMRKLAVARHEKHHDDSIDLRGMEDAKFNEYFSQLEAKTAKDLLQQEATRLENLRLKKEAEQAEAKRVAEQKKIQAEKAKAEKEAQAKIDAERAEKEKIAKELHAQKIIAEAAEKAEQERIAAEARAKELELQKGDKDLFNDMVSDIENIKTKYANRFKSAANKKKFSDTTTLLDKVINQIK